MNEPASEMKKVGAALREESGSLANAAIDDAKRRAEESKGVAAESLHSFADAVRKAGDELGSKDQAAASRIIREAANGLESLSRNLGGSSIEEIVDGIRTFGRRNPTAFLAGSILAGVALGRFARASGRHSHEEGRDAKGSESWRGTSSDTGTSSATWREPSTTGTFQDGSSSAWKTGSTSAGDGSTRQPQHKAVTDKPRPAFASDIGGNDKGSSKP